jgi:hypothetical protein
MRIEKVLPFQAKFEKIIYFDKMDRINRILLPFRMKGNKSSTLFPFPILAGLNILPSIREGRREIDPLNPV